MAGGESAAVTGTAAAAVEELVRSTREVADGFAESSAQLRTLMALADELLEAVDAGEPGSALVARVGEMAGQAAAVRGRLEVLVPTFYALKEAVAAAGEPPRCRMCDCIASLQVRKEAK
ncbi:hypothetical protein ACP4OV_006584 [Aristida adscensionis]